MLVTVYSDGLLFIKLMLLTPNVKGESISHHRDPRDYMGGFWDFFEKIKINKVI